MRRSEFTIFIYSGGTVHREELARKLARKDRLSSAAARDQVDEVVHRILQALRKGRPVELPGVGKLVSESNRRRSPK